jgi:hypothetical protein
LFEKGPIPLSGGLACVRVFRWKSLKTPINGTGMPWRFAG